MSHDFYPKQSPNVSEEAPGVPWDPRAGEIVAGADDVYDDPVGPRIPDLEPKLSNTKATHALWNALQQFGADPDNPEVVRAWDDFINDPERPTEVSTTVRTDQPPMS